MGVVQEENLVPYATVRRENIVQKMEVLVLRMVLINVHIYKILVETVLLVLISIEILIIIVNVNRDSFLWGEIMKFVACVIILFALLVGGMPRIV